MTLIGPILDDRTYERLREELIRRIPVHTPEWTDVNESDPGVVLLELFAFLGESLLYRFNQIPDATKVAFLRLLDVPSRPAAAARVLVTAVTQAPRGVQVLAGRELRAGAIAFETRDELYAWPLEVLGVGKVRAPEPDPGDAYERARRDEAVRRLKDKGEVAFYEPVVLPADPLAPEAAPLDVDGTLDQALWVALLTTPATDLAELRGRTIFLGIEPEESITAPFTAAGEAGRYRSTGLGQPGPGVRWQLWRGGAAGPFLPLEVVRDGTKGLQQGGVVALTLPRELPVLPAEPGTARTDPPRLDEPAQAVRVAAWLRATRPPGAAEGMGRVRWVGVNAVEAVQERTAAQAELLGTGTGEAGQSYRLTQQNVRPGTVELEVEEAGGWERWQEADDFTRTRDGDRHFVVDRADGLVRFGPGGRQGRVPQIGERVRVRSYRYGGGAAGNVPAGAVTTLTGGGPQVANPLPARGGEDAERLDAALERIPAEVHRRDRAVTAADFRDLAARLPEVARAEALPLFHPATPAVPTPGAVSVVVFPRQDARDPGAPVPDRGLLRRVAQELDARRLITTELYVLPPDYVPIAVSAGVAVHDGHPVDAVRRWVELILRQFLAPVPPYGPDGGGWPLGRVIRRAELEAVAVQVEGVDYLEGLLLAERVGDTWVRRDLITPASWQVPRLAEVTVVAGPPLQPGAGHPEPPVSGKVDYLPLPREVC
ncbi:putative baseplate assembly protein [Nonomuraea zeae]|uniref:Putative baseplate assembly protein n=1 Tax=Nonomuraea zeae TaxID=1642303 RepID=A0A5S4FET4_9ACTN|nr:putative baseplate assembly protein [Nonomuraea zeae]TMR17050.1 putative baseplate assembly protein [Nonomuraea zeae]